MLETMRFFANFFKNPVKCEIMHRYYEMFLFQVRYSSSWACVQEVVAREGAQALYRGAGVNIVRGVAGAGVLSGFDKLKQFYIAKRHVL